MKKILYAWIEQVLEFDSHEEVSTYILELGKNKVKTDKDFAIIGEEEHLDGTITLRVRKQYNNNMFPID